MEQESGRDWRSLEQVKLSGSDRCLTGLTTATISVPIVLQIAVVLGAFFVANKAMPHDVFFQEPTMLTSSPADWENDIALYRDLGVLS